MSLEKHGVFLSSGIAQSSNNIRTVKSAVVMLGAGLLLSGCVSASQQSQAPTPLPQFTANIANPETVPAPSDDVNQVLALAADPNAPASVPRRSPLRLQQQTAAAPTPTSSATTPSVAPVSATPSPAPSTVTPSQTLLAAAAVPTQSEPTAPARETLQQVTDEAVQKKQPETAAKGNFFSRLFSRNKRKSLRISEEEAAARSTTSIASTNARTQTSDLPGISSNSDTNATAQQNTQVASLGGLGRISPNGLRLQHEKVQVACLKPDILRLIAIIERHYGKKPIITSGYRSPKRNSRSGGAKNSMHIFCKAVDLQVEGVSKWDLAKYLRSIPGRGGVGTYCRTKSVHIDTGSVRDWHHPCRRSAKRRKKA